MKSSNRIEYMINLLEIVVEHNNKYAYELIHHNITNILHISMWVFRT